MTADDLFGASLPLRAGYRPRERAAEWLRQFLATGKRRATEVLEAARAAGIPNRTLDRVKATVGAVSEAENHGGKVEWGWRDPKADAAEWAELRGNSSADSWAPAFGPRPTTSEDSP